MGEGRWLVVILGKERIGNEAYAVMSALAVGFVKWESRCHWPLDLVLR